MPSDYAKTYCYEDDRDPVRCHPAGGEELNFQATADRLVGKVHSGNFPVAVSGLYCQPRQKSAFKRA